MRFIKTFNQVALFVILVGIFGSCGIWVWSNIEKVRACPASREIYAANCEISQTLAKIGERDLTDAERENCSCARR
jgi:hypothetical protein